MLTSAGQRGDARRCRRLGIAAYLTKPVRRAELLAAACGVMGAGRGRREGDTLITRHSLRRSRRRLRVLVAEDNPVSQRVAARLLEKRGYRVAVARDGREALERLARERFDAVLMDVQMPGMSGMEATTAIRRTEKETGGHLRIIAMTAHAMKGDRERCLAAGMDAYVSKPVRAEELETALAGLPSGGPAGPIREPPGSSAPDRGTLLARFEGDAALLDEVAGLFKESAPGMLRAIGRALARRDARDLERAVHTLKGSMAHFGPGAALDSAGRLETLARGADLRAARRELGVLRKEVARLRGALAARGKVDAA
jgi:CheY-like chemotaxis protein